jgi:predicted secreted protein
VAEVRNNDLRISGSLRAGNLEHGRVFITPVANTPTSTTVSGLDLKGAGDVVGLCASVTSVPGTSVHETSVSSVGSTGMTIWVYRVNTTGTSIDWMMWRNRS